jgi:hypothetical protein
LAAVSFESFFNYIETKSALTLSEDDKVNIQNAFKSKNLRKRQYLLQEGDICKYMTFFVKGSGCMYSVNDKGHYQIVRFAVENWWLGDYESYHLKTPSLYNIEDDVFNNENESFYQETKLMENEYSINLPTKFYYKGKWNKGWINVVNPFRATIVLGTPGSGKSCAIVNNYIKQHIEKGFSMYIYDYKFDDLSIIVYNHLLKHQDKYKIKPKFYVINFDDPQKSHRCNPLNPDFMTDISDAYEAAYTIMLNLNRSWIQKQGDFLWNHPSFF